jgi:hypothetical protein
METLDSKIRTAKKEHKCDFCGGIINAGEKYDWQKIVSDGELYEWKAHCSCSAIASELDMYERCDNELNANAFQECIDEEYYLGNGNLNELTNKTFSERLEVVKIRHAIK